MYTKYLKGHIWKRWTGQWVGIHMWYQTDRVVSESFLRLRLEIGMNCVRWATKISFPWPRSVYGTLWFSSSYSNHRKFDGIKWIERWQGLLFLLEFGLDHIEIYPIYKTEPLKTIISCFFPKDHTWAMGRGVS